MAKTEVKPKKQPVGRKCSICGSDKLTQINKLLAEGVSFRNISLQLLGNEKHFTSVGRHAENCLKMQIGATMLTKRSEQAFDFATELQKLYFKATKMVTALEKWLVNADDPDSFDIGPRDSEVLVTFLDYNDVSERTGKPTRKKAMLADLLKRAEAPNNIEAMGLSSTAVDNRKLYLDAFKTLNDRLEQIAKFHGLWQKDKTNEADAELERIRALVTSWAKDNGTTIDQELQFVFSRYGQTLPKNVTQQLVSDLEN